MREFDPFAWEFHEDPYPTYRWLRDEAPFYRNEKLGFVALSRYDDVLTGFKDVERFSNKDGVALEQSSQGDPSDTASFLAMDPPRHDAMRGLVARGFTPRRVMDLEPRIRAIATQHIDRFIEQGRCDFIQDFAGKLPMDVVSEMIGVPPEDRDRLRFWADTLMHREDGVIDIPKEGMEAALNMIVYFQDLVAQRKRQRTTDLASALLDVQLEGQSLTDREVISFLFLMVIAGNETTTKLIGNAILALLRNPQQLERLRAEPGLMENAVEELLRYDGPVQLTSRLAREDRELCGRTARRGDQVVLLLAGANRDPSAFPDPDRLDLGRRDVRHLAFSQGIHFCLGAQLARLEASLALGALVTRLPGLRLADASIRWSSNTVLRGPEALQIAW